jgi:uncharacterized membrane protein
LPDEPKTAESKALEPVPDVAAERPSQKQPASLPPEVERQVAAYVERAPEPVRAVLIARVVRGTFVGPLPPPEMIEAYNRVIPSMGRELLDAFKDEGNHRRSQADKELDCSIADTKEARALERRGMNVAAVVAVLGLLISGAAVLTGHDVAGTILGGGELVVLVALFIAGRQKTADPPQEGTDRRQLPK